MSAAEERVQPAEERTPRWLGESFWARLNRVEADHQRLQKEHECAGRDLEQRARSAEFQDVWQRYCRIIAELDRTTAELEQLRTRAD